MGRVLSRAGTEGPSRFFYDVDASDPTSRFNPGAPSWRKIVEDPAVDIVVEVTGSPVAEAIIEEALWRGKSVVTANKRVMSRSGYQLVRLAESRGAVLAYEASVGGGMPIVQTIGSSIGGRVTALLTIINGTTNFILSEMWEGALKAANPKQAAGLYPAALAVAISKGLAEADPSDDVLAEDPRSKLIILAGLAFGVRLRSADLYIRGIARRGRLTVETIFTASDLALLRSLGYVPKLLAGAQRHQSGGQERIVAWAQPAAVPATHPIAGVAGAENACLLRVESPVSSPNTGREGGTAKGYDIMLRGPGAGGPETASSVISDILFCARQLASVERAQSTGEAHGAHGQAYNYGAGAFSQSQEYLGTPSLLLEDAIRAPFLLRFLVTGGSLAGVTAKVKQALRTAGVEPSDVPAPAGASGSIYLRTAPASIGQIERGIERALNACGSGTLSMDVLYLPVLEGSSWSVAGMARGNS